MAQQLLLFILNFYLGKFKNTIIILEGLGPKRCVVWWCYIEVCSWCVGPVRARGARNTPK